MTEIHPPNPRRSCGTRGKFSDLTSGCVYALRTWASPSWEGLVPGCHFQFPRSSQPGHVCVDCGRQPGGGDRDWELPTKGVFPALEWEELNYGEATCVFVLRARLFGSLFKTRAPKMHGLGWPELPTRRRPRGWGCGRSGTLGSVVSAGCSRAPGDRGGCRQPCGAAPASRGFLSMDRSRTWKILLTFKSGWSRFGFYVHGSFF